ncbi:30S ribosome-binding factor RbfA [Isoalcanivorax beigongshangi]|uniref:Ribosome-binding factor A n=1 Tax=Isoalcanivorax beigongshangi TaxID=3238810 RepID=A0ABV4AFQ7_9GAMM
MSRHRRPQGFQRTDRIGDHIQRELASLIRTGVKDPRLAMVTIQEVRVSRDLTWADVYFTVLGQDAEAGQQAEQVLGGAAGFLRSELARDLNTRTTPRLRFHYDRLPEEASRLSSLIAQARSSDAELRDGDQDDDAQDDDQQP